MGLLRDGASEEGLRKALTRIRELKKEFWSDVRCWARTRNSTKRSSEPVGLPTFSSSVS